MKTAWNYYTTQSQPGRGQQNTEMCWETRPSSVWLSTIFSDESATLFSPFSVILAFLIGVLEVLKFWYFLFAYLLVLLQNMQYFDLKSLF